MGWSTSGWGKKLKKAAGNVVKAGGKAVGDAADVGTRTVTGGAVSLDGKSGWAQGNTFMGGASGIAGIDKGKQLFTSASKNISGRPEELKEEELAPIVEEDPALKEELENQKKRARMSTVLAGKTPGVEGFTSARRTLLGI